ncbi:MAG: serine acetyltransferase [Fuerstiella sp.]|jgi:serine O-acetyltransferase|nr:serine acetyltransferase [Fuerstiella sp.]
MIFRDGDDRMMDKIAEALFTDTGTLADPLPSVDAVITIASNLRELLFPGVRTAGTAMSAGGRSQCARNLRHIRQSLSIEIHRALSHVRKATLRIHDEAVHDEAMAGNHATAAADLADALLDTLPRLKKILQQDAQAAFDGDPAARTREEIILCYPGIEAIIMFRLAHELHRLAVPYLPRIITEWAHRETGIDIHPGATIGPLFFIDHGTGVVIGETCEIGASVTLYQGVTLGAWSFPRDEDGELIRGARRHPTLEDSVTVYSNATVLGGTTVIGAGSQIGSSVTLSRSIPPNTIVTIDKPSLRFREAG